MTSESFDPPIQSVIDAARRVITLWRSGAPLPKVGMAIDFLADAVEGERTGEGESDAT